MSKEYSLSFKHYGEAGKKKVGDIPKFDFYGFERIENSMLLEGSLTKKITRGKNKGEVKWIPESEKKIILTDDEVVDWCKEYEEDTGNCAQCFGEGKVMKSWSAKDGTKYRPCTMCKGSGNPQ